MLGRHIRTIAIYLLMAMSLSGASGPTGDWDREHLDAPLATDGLILRSGENTYSFQLNESGIPDEPLRIVAHMSESVDPSTGIPEGSSDPVYDPETEAYVASDSLVYIGAKLDEILPATSTYTDNNQQNEFTGTNIDLIRGATATLNVTYSPLYTHEKGVLWYPLQSCSWYSDYKAVGGQSQCTIDARTATIDSRAGARSGSVTLRALSVYDEWFDSMERLYDADYGDEDYRVENWKEVYLSLTPEQHRNSGMTVAEIREKEASLSGEALEAFHKELADQAAIWGYPPDSAGESGHYQDFQITVRNPIEKAVFRSESQTQTNKGDGVLAEYVFINDQLRHPDIVATDEIWCYDTSDASLGSKSVDAFYISTDLVPDFGYQLEFELVEGAGIGSIDFTDIDKKDNAFRFIPHGPKTDSAGNSVTNYGNVVIRATATDVNFSRLFTLHYLPSSMRMVKYIGDDWATNRWNHGIVTKTENGMTVVDNSISGEWDVYWPGWSGSGTYPWENAKSDPSLFGLECIVLYPGESFDLAAVSFVRPDGTGTSLKQPYYMQSGVPAVDTSTPAEDGNGYKVTYTKYAATYAVYSDMDNAKAIPGVLSYASGYGAIETTEEDGHEFDYLYPTSTDTGRSYWYTESCNTITAQPDSQGIYYLSYTVSPINEQTGEPDLENGVLTGGIYLIISDPVDQVLLGTVMKQTNASIAVEIPFAISAVQRFPTLDEKGNEYPSHWFMGESKGIAEEEPVVAGETEGILPMYRGKAYAAFNKNVDLSTFEGLSSLLSTTYVNSMGSVSIGNITSYFKVSMDTLAEGIPGGLNEPTLADIRLTGDYGLSRFPRIYTLLVEDHEGILTAANTVDGYFDFTSLSITHYKHVGMADAGRGITVFGIPKNIVKLELDGGEDAPNKLSCTLSFPASAKRTLEYIDIGNNSFPEVTLDGFSELETVKAAGSAGRIGSDGDRYLNIVNTPSLAYVLANETQFNYIIASFKGLNATDFFDSSLVETGNRDTNTQKGVKTAMQADGSDWLYGVNVSGALGYLELTDDPYLESLIASSTVKAGRYDSYTTTSSPSDRHWIRVLNLGGNNPLMNNTGNPDYVGFNPQDGLPWELSDTKRDYSGGTNHIRYLKLNMIHRFYSDNSSDKTERSASQIVAGEISDPISSLPLFSVNVVSGFRRSTQGNVNSSSLSPLDSYSDSSIMDFEYRRADIDTFRFEHITEDSCVRLDNSDAYTLYVVDHDGYLSIKGDRNLDVVSVNASNTSVGNSVLDLSSTGIRTISGLSGLSFKDITLNTSSNIELTEGESAAVSVDADDITFTDSMTVSCRTSNSSVAGVSQVYQKGKYIWYITANGPGNATVTVTGTVGSTSHSKTISVTVREEIVSTYTLELWNENRQALTDGIEIRDDDTIDGFPLELRVFSTTNGTKDDMSDSLFNESIYDPSEIEELVEWTVLDPSILAIENDSVFANKVILKPLMMEASTMITASCAGIDINAEVIIYGDRYSISLTESDIRFDSPDADSAIIEAHLIDQMTGSTADYAMTETFVWSVADSSIASISASGANRETASITPLKAGTTTFRVTYREGNPDYPADEASGTITVLDDGKAIVSKSSSRSVPQKTEALHLRDAELGSGYGTRSGELEVSNVTMFGKPLMIGGKEYIVPEWYSSEAWIEEYTKNTSASAMRPVMAKKAAPGISTMSYVDSSPSTSAVEASVYKLYVNSCSSLSTIDLDYNDNRATSRVRILYAIGCSSLQKIEVTNSSSLTSLYAYNNSSLRNLYISKSSFSTIDVHNCRLNAGTVKVGSLEIYSGLMSGPIQEISDREAEDHRSTFIHTIADWRSSVNGTFIAYGNNIVAGGGVYHDDFWQDTHGGNGVRYNVVVTIGDSIPSGYVISEHKAGYHGHWGGGPAYSGGIEGGETVLQGSNVGKGKTWGKMIYTDPKYVTAGYTGYLARQRPTFYTYENFGSWPKEVHVTVHPFGDPK